MYLILIGWLYVVVMMAVVEAASPNGSLLGAFFTFLLYGMVPIALLLFIGGTPARRRARHQAEQAALAAHASMAAAVPSSTSSSADIAPPQPDTVGEPPAKNT